MRKTWIAVLVSALSVWLTGARAEDAPAPRQPLKTIPSGLPAAPTAESPETIKAPTPTGTPAPAPAAAEACTTPAKSCAPCARTYLTRLKQWVCFRSTSCGLCSHTCCGQRWVPIYLFFLTPCVEGCGVPRAAPCSSCSSPGKPACAPAVMPGNGSGPVPSVPHPAPGKDGPAGTGGSVAGASSTSWFARLGLRTFNGPGSAPSR